jgi:CRISPR/Cas system CMR-associated protein Cmr5 small subunit
LTPRDIVTVGGSKWQVTLEESSYHDETDYQWYAHKVNDPSTVVRVGYNDTLTFTEVKDALVEAGHYEMTSVEAADKKRRELVDRLERAEEDHARAMSNAKMENAKIATAVLDQTRRFNEAERRLAKAVLDFAEAKTALETFDAQ